MAKPLQVAFQGARGAFSEQACRQLLGPDVELRPCERFVEIFEALQKGEVDHTVVPIENTLAGSVHENYDHLLEYRLPIIAETRVRIVHNLIGRPEAEMSGIRRAISHPVALGQCIRFFREHPEIRAESHYDTGGSVKTIMEGDDATTAAIASSAAAALYGAKILKSEIEDNRENYTRFFLLAPSAPDEPLDGPGPLKTSIAFATRNEPGALFKCMAAFGLRDINLTKIESRPMRGRPWEYLFYVDLIGDPREERCGNALRHLSETTEFLAVLGTYRQSA
ncbi:MAG: prephenate dehydratase [Bryobacterales bacterium]|nr:prephenate dehydratase [Bryobacterales bacterium]